MNHLCVSTCEAIKVLALKGWSGRRIARELAVNRETVARYLGPSKPAIPPLGSEGTGTGSAPKPAIPTVGSRAGRRSLCEVHLAEITLAIEQALSAQRIYQDLVTSHAFAGSYTSVKRFVHCRRSSQKLPFGRWESEPGEEAQIDFGQGAWVIDEHGKRRRPHLFRVILSHSRKGYSEVLWRQTTEEFIRGLKNAFRSFGGVPDTDDSTDGDLLWFRAPAQPRFAAPSPESSARSTRYRLRLRCLSAPTASGGALSSPN